MLQCTPVLIGASFGPSLNAFQIERVAGVGGSLRGFLGDSPQYSLLNILREEPSTARGIPAPIINAPISSA